MVTYEQMTELSQPKRCHHTTNTMEMYPSKHYCTTKESAIKLSPYERRIGKSISLCSKCLGEGKVRGPLSKKARARSKTNHITSNNDSTVPTKASENFTPLMKLCILCDGSGLVANPLPSTPTENEAVEANDVSEVMYPRSAFSVAIIGGGIGGFALAAALQHRNISCVVYERDVSFEERSQGYGLTMQQGARALRSLGFFSFVDDDSEFEDGGYDSNEQSNGAKLGSAIEFVLPVSKFGIHSKRHVVHEPDGNVVGEWGMQIWGGRFEKNGRKHAKRQNAHISRQNLRKLLMEMLRPGTIRWGHKLIDYSDGSVDGEDANSGKSNLNLTFHCRQSEGREGAQGESEEVITTSHTVIVGCDGIRSLVRAKKLGEDVTPLRYLGCIVILGIARSPFSPLTNGETVFQTADGVTRLYAMPYAQSGEGEKGAGLSMWQLSFPMEESDAKNLSALGPTALKAEALKRCGEWHDPIPALLLQTEEDLITGYPCYDRAVVEKRDFRDGCNSATVDSFVTMLGDAAHPMSPFKGQGANQALLDAILLSRKLYKSVCVDKTSKNVSLNDSITTALTEFEEEMLDRSAIKVLKSANAAQFLHSEVAISKGNVTRGAAAAVEVDDARKGQLLDVDGTQ